MTSDEFRKDEMRAGELRSVLSNPILQEALLLIHDSKTIVDAPTESDPLTSVRLLSNLAGRADVIRELYLLIAPLELAPATKLPDYGVTDPPPPEWNPAEHL